MRFSTVALAVAALAALAVGNGSDASAATITVCWDGSEDYTTIQEAINAAANDDEIVVCPGTYAAGSCTAEFFGTKSLTLRSTDPDDPAVVASTIISCLWGGDPDHVAVRFWRAEENHHDSVIRGFTIRNNAVSGLAGVVCANASPIIQDNVIADNTYGIQCLGSDGHPSIKRNIITRNNCGILLWSLSSPVIADNVIQHSGGDGIDVSSGSGVIRNNIIAENGGAGIDCNNNEDLIIEHNTIVDNTYGLEEADELTAPVRNCIIWGNLDDYHDGAPLLLSYCCLSSYLPPEYEEETIHCAPLFVDAGRGNYHLAAYSPCINAGDPSYPPQPNDTDIDGDDRVLLGRLDIGADEATAQSTTDNDTDDLPDDWEIRYFGSIAAYGAGDNPDCDDLLNEYELYYGTDPTALDSVLFDPENSWRHDFYVDYVGDDFADVSSSPALYDLNGDGPMEILIGGDHYGGAAISGLYCISHEGEFLWRAETGGYAIDSSPAVADVDHDGYAEIFIGTDSQQQQVLAVDHMGNHLWDYHQADVSGFAASPAIADVVDDAGGELEVVMSAGANFVSGAYRGLYCFDGNPVDGVDEDADGESETGHGQAEEALICGATDDQIEARVQGQHVVWADPRNGTDYDIYLYDLLAASQQLICDDGADQREPAVYGNRVVWRDERSPNPGIYLYDPDAEPTGSDEYAISICASDDPQGKKNPAIFGDIIVWADRATPEDDYDLHGYDLSVDTDEDEIPNYLESPRPDPDPAEFVICDEPGDQVRPAIYMDVVAWEDNRTVESAPDIYMKNLTTDVETAVCTNSASQERPSIFCGSKIVWQDNRTASKGYDVFLYHVGTGATKRLCYLTGDQTNPTIYGNNVVWFDDASNQFTVYNLRTDTTSTPAITVTHSDPAPVLWGTRVVWIDQGTSDLDVFTWGADYDILWQALDNVMIIASAAIGDVNGDGQLEVVVGGQVNTNPAFPEIFNLYCLNGATGDVLWTYPASAGIESSAAIAQADDDDALEIFFGTLDGTFVALDGESGELEWQVELVNPIVSSPAVGDLDGDGELEVVVGVKDGLVYCFEANPDETDEGVENFAQGTDYDVLWSSFVKKWDRRIISSPALLDFDGDGRLEVAIGSPNTFLYVFRWDGVLLGQYCWASHMGAIVCSPAVADIDADSRLEVVYSAREFAGLFCAEIASVGCQQPAAGAIEWRRFRNQDRNLGLYANTHATAWRSIRTHGSGAGDLPIELDPTATCTAVVCETRRYGVQQIEVDFDSVVTTIIGTVQAVNTETQVADPADDQYIIDQGDGTSTLVIEFAGGLPNEACYRIDLQDNILTLTDDTDCLVQVLAGNINGDNKTDLSDMGLAKYMNGTPLTEATAKYDVTVDGKIDLTDMALIKTLNGTQAVCP
ncbi:MAG: right-handed parallel beta-helix repeat-containing protein [Phycisphaerae bacterium]|nr:right-handed parallel beta-helix repeat-containing protein [Phycisphaerae bacterium]